MEGEDMDEMGSGTEQQQQQPVSVDKNRVEVHSGDVSAVPEAQTTADKVRLMTEVSVSDNNNNNSL